MKYVSSVVDASYNIVNRHNILTLSLAIKQSIMLAEFIAIDIEFTGLGDMKKTRDQNIENRYLSLSQLAKSHAVNAVGLSIFERKSDNEYHVHNYHFVMLCAKDHTISPSSMSFLVEHGFDFNDQFRNGIPYHPGNDVLDRDDIQPNSVFRNLFMDIICQDCPVVTHNGLLDLVFLYQSFYAELPSTLSVFIADLSGMFTGGVFDTKYISDFITRESSSFLSYLYRKYERAEINQKAEKQNHFQVTIKDPIQHKQIQTKFKLYQLGLAPTVNKPVINSGKPFCEQYAFHGFCQDGKGCIQSHDLDIILDFESQPQSHIKKKLKGEEKKSKPVVAMDSDPTFKGDGKKTKATVANENELANQTDQDIPLFVSKASLFKQDHSACFDAYMTGYIFAHQLLTEDEVLKFCKNRIYLIGKQMPLIIEKSRYSNFSQNHLLKMKKRTLL
ncbi:ribonuclease CAF1 [Globomyces pollinis-pini]|nr:ribonuclease CAF1 [Globomyces pollinis-pini]